MIQRDFLLEQIQRLADRLVEARQKVKEQKLAEAGDEIGKLIQEADALWDEAEDTDALRPVCAQLHGELGLIDSLLGSIEPAKVHLDKSVDLLRPIADQGKPEIDAMLATAMLNAAALGAAARRFDSALGLLDEAIERLTLLAEADASRRGIQGLLVSALHNRAAARQQNDDPEGAAVDCRTALDRSEALMHSGADHALVPYIESALRLTVFELKAERPDEALEMAQRALGGALKACELKIGRFPILFVRSKMALADVLFARNELARAEDHLFQAIDSIPELLDSRLIAMDYYADLVGRTDDDLASGGLPRDEVEASYAELLAGLDVRCDNETIRDLARARFDLLVNDRRESAEELVAQEHEVGADLHVDMMKQKLKQALESHRQA
jgi:tetratricopeptide (TPR) repeat protein